MIAIVAVLLLVAGTGFFLVGTLGILRLPDLLSRLHALTKADTVGLGLIVLGLCLLSGEFATIVKLVLIWGLALVSAATVSQLVAARVAVDPGRSDTDRPGADS
ncbi:monovalent cation/H(+) antiporter subunit G [Fodinicurvata sp. EGI_FJ10296]|uniref:cation:proton antiporter n=1 Tax=Fodinicurvata sp. EGI_FJ10296 TaxID=3231908 RepID=UPI003454049F